MRKTARNLTAASLMASAIALPALAHENVRGVVVDKATNEPLIGAVIRVAGTQDQVVLTDSIGGFKLENLPTGAYTISINYLGYLPEVIDSIRLSADSLFTFSVKLEARDISLDHATVVGRRDKESENVALTVQRNAVVAVQQVSASEMSRKGASDAEAVVSKVAGISKQDGVKNVFVRGLGDRYNVTTLNEFSVPSEDPEYKNISLDFFESDIIQSLDVNKVFNASTEGDVAGARINVNSKELSGKGGLAIGLSGGFNTQTAGHTLLLPDGMNAFGGARGSWPSAEGLDALYSEQPIGLFRNRLNPRRHHVPVNQSYGISGGHRFLLGERELPLSLFAVLGHSTDFNYSTEAIRDAGTNNRNIYRDQTGKKSEQSVRQLGMANVTFSIPGTHKLAYNFLTVHDSRASVGNYMGQNSKFGETSYADEGGLYQRQQVNENFLLVNQLDYNWTPSVRHKLNVGAAYNTMEGDEPDRRDLYMGLDTDNNALVPLVGEGYNNRSYTELKEKDLNVRAGYTFRLTDDLENPSNLRVGYKARLVSDDFRAADYGFYSSGRPQLDVDYPDFDGHVNSEGIRTFVNYLPSSYTVDKDIHTGYVEATYGFPAGLTANLGVRYDHVDMAVDYDIQQRLRGHNDFKKHFVLPSLNLRYDLTDRHALRLGLSRTYTLPQAKEISPYQYIGAAFNSVGNPDLKPSDNYNADLKWDWYMGEGEIVTVNGFYKYIKDPISRIQTTGGGTYMRYENVSNHATVAGVELDVRKKLFDLGGKAESVHNLTAGVNASYIYTSVRVPNSTSLTYENKGSQLEGAAPWLVNADLTYQWTRGERQVTTALVFNYFSDRLYSIGMEDYQDVMEEGVATLDFVASAKLTKRLSLSFKAKNLLNPTHKLTRRATVKERDDEGNYQYVGKGDKLVMNSYRNAIDLSLGLSLKF